jgi:glycosyltransferase involved in cell wall biosynthesis
VKPVLFVTGHVPAVRRRGLELLHEREGIELALFGGRHEHGAAPAPPPPGVPAREVSQRAVGALARSGRYRAVIAGTGGRVALPEALRGARRARVPFVFWAALWHQPRTPAHLAAHPLMRHVYRRADAIVTYGEHVSEYVRSRGARNVHVAPQAVDNAFWSAATGRTRSPEQPLRAVYVGRAERAKGLHVLLEAWREADLAAGGATLRVVGENDVPPLAGVLPVGRADPEQLRNFFAEADVLVVPSVPTRRFLEPWGLVVNEAMNQATTVIATNAVGAAAGGLVRDGHNGIVLAAGDASALAGALRGLAADRERCRTLGLNGRRDVAAFTAEAWAGGFVAALQSVDCSRSPLVASR